MSNQAAKPVLIQAEKLADGLTSTSRPGQAILVQDGRIRAGGDCVTCGDHIWKRMEVKPLLESEPRLVRPLNYSEKAAGRGMTVLTSRNGVRIGIATVVGRIFMGPASCPFQAAENALRLMPPEAHIRIIEIHAEATSEKVALAWKLDGVASLVFGTHTHIPTADARVLPNGTAYITDLGMTGPYDSVIGRDKKNVIFKFETGMHAPFSVALGDVRMCGVLVTVAVSYTHLTLPTSDLV